MIGVELFAGAGGLSYGAECAGITVAKAVEKHKPAASSFQVNHYKTDVICEDVRTIDPKSFDLPSSSIILFGGPPCQGFSTSNQRNRSKENEGNWLFKEFLRFTEVLSPQVVVFENVSGIVHTAEGFFLGELVSRLEKLGYFVSHAVLDASDFGVPQKRNRFFCIGSKSTKIDLANIAKRSSLITVGEAIDDLPELPVGNSIDEYPYRTEPRSEYSKLMRNGTDTCTGNLVTQNATHIVERYKYIPPGGNWADIPKELMATYKDASRCHTGIYRRLEYDRPSIVLGNFRKNMLIHPTQDRGLSVREAARLQSFPDHYRFHGSIGQQQQQVGNAVPPLMAQAVFKAILSQTKLSGDA